MQVKISSGSSVVCTEFQFDLNTGEVSAHDCPQLFELDVPQGLPNLDPLPEGCIDFGFNWDSNSEINPNDLSPATKDSICTFLKSDAPVECIPPGVRSLSLPILHPLKCFSPGNLSRL